MTIGGGLPPSPPLLFVESPTGKGRWGEGKRKRGEGRAGNETVSSRKKSRRDETISISSRLVTLSREMVSNSNFCLKGKIPRKKTKFGKIWVNIFFSFLLGLVYRLVL